MNINSLRYCLRQSHESLARNFWLAVVTAGIIAISLVIFGGFLLVAINAGQFVRNVESNLEVNVFLDDDADLETIQLKLDTLDGVQSYIFVPKEQGLEEFGRALGERVPLGGLAGEDNPLPDVFRVRVSQAELVPALAREIQSYPGVEMTDYGEKMVDALLKFTGWLKTLFFGVSFLLGLGAVFLIVTTIRLSVLARKEEVAIMKYLGAGNWFIRFPFILEGMVMGWLGTMAATVTLGLAYYLLVTFLLQQETLAFFLQPVTDLSTLIPLFTGLLVMGTLMGGVGSLVSVRKFLRV